MPVLERVTAWDMHTRAWAQFDVKVARRVFLSAACGCWSHKLFQFEIIVTPDALLYFRREHSDENFREIGQCGPMSLEVTRTERS